MKSIEPESAPRYWMFALTAPEIRTSVWPPPPSSVIPTKPLRVIRSMSLIEPWISADT